MKIHFDNVSIGAQTGPNVFAQRLAKSLLNLGHDLEFEDGRGADVSLVFIEPSGKPLAQKRIQRLDGIWTKPETFLSANSHIRSFYDTADGVVFQSEFDKKFIENHWSKNANARVIRNGVEVSPVTKFESYELAKIRETYDVIYVASAHWHAQKRLAANVDMFEHLKLITNKKSCLIVLGSNPDYVRAKQDVYYAGAVPASIYMQVYSMANWMIHLAWRDHCPNTVVECLSQKTPVICSSDGGTVELVGKFGVTLDERAQNDLMPFDFDQPPTIDVKQITSLPNLADAQAPDVSIETCVSKYVSMFESIVG